MMGQLINEQNGRMSVRIRPCTEEDIGVLAVTIQSSFRDVAERFGLTRENCPRHPSNCTGEWIREGMDRGVTYFALENDNLVAGCVALERASSEVCYMERLSVLAHHRRCGFGKMLVARVFSEAKVLSVRRVEIGVIEEPTVLRDWYKKLGFVEVECKDFPHLPFRVAFMARELR